jgi:hypothetical protein
LGEHALRRYIRLMTDRTISPTGAEAAPGSRRMSDRVVIALALGGVAALFGTAALLWWREGLGVFVEVILAGIAACF